MLWSNDPGLCVSVSARPRLRGIQIWSRCSWADICQLRILIRFKDLVGTGSHQLKVYQTSIYSILEFAAPVFTSGLIKLQSQKLEIVQRKAFAIILGTNYTSQHTALFILDQERLDTRQLHLCLKFAKKCTMSPNIAKCSHQTELQPMPFRESHCRTTRTFISRIPFITRLLDMHAMLEE